MFNTNICRAIICVHVMRGGMSVSFEDNVTVREIFFVERRVKVLKEKLVFRIFSTVQVLHWQ